MNRIIRAHHRMAGRVLLLAGETVFGGGGDAPTPEALAALATRSGVRFALLDATRAPYADSDGLRWLLRLRRELESACIVLRVAAAPGSRVWRNLMLLGVNLDLHESARSAWKCPWPASLLPPAARKETRCPKPRNTVCCAT